MGTTGGIRFVGSKDAPPARTQRPLEAQGAFAHLPFRLVDPDSKRRASSAQQHLGHTMKLLAPHELTSLEILYERLMFKEPRLNRIHELEAEALRKALPRWIAMERTVTEAHIDAARTTPAYPFENQDDTYSGDYPGVEIYLWPDAEKIRPWWRRLGSWWRRHIESLGDIP
jgi:hypothetical protein